MCRWLAYTGSLVLLTDVLYRCPRDFQLLRVAFRLVLW
jgi:hypothetical protein